jgi:hypothetical protein
MFQALCFLMVLLLELASWKETATFIRVQEKCYGIWWQLMTRDSASCEQYIVQ